ncbi:MAG TPA: cytochrome c-type biogenesis protein [Rhizomicrobium sp.]
MKRIFLALLFLASFATGAAAYSGPEKLSDPALEARAVALQKTLRCVVCQSQSLDESNAPLAADLRLLIRARIEAGDSDAQVDQYLVTRYGDFILMKPPLEPQTFVLWFGPLAILLIGGTTLGFVLWRARKRLRAEIR